MDKEIVIGKKIILNQYKIVFTPETSVDELESICRGINHFMGGKTTCVRRIEKLHYRYFGYMDPNLGWCAGLDNSRPEMNYIITLLTAEEAMMFRLRADNIIQMSLEKENAETAYEFINI